MTASFPQSVLDFLGGQLTAKAEKRACKAVEGFSAATTQAQFKKAQRRAEEQSVLGFSVKKFTCPIAGGDHWVSLPFMRIIAKQVTIMEYRDASGEFQSWVKWTHIEPLTITNWREAAFMSSEWFGKFVPVLWQNAEL